MSKSRASPTQGDGTKSLANRLLSRGRVTSVEKELRTLRRATQGPGPVSIYPSAFTVPALSIESLNLTSTT